MNQWLQETELVGDLVTLVPLRPQHRDSLVEAASDGNLWELWFTSVPSPKTIDRYITTALEEQAQDQSLPFVVIENQTNNVIGATRYLNASSAHRRLEIGYTWYAKRAHGTLVNPECKLLLLTHAFETLATIAVEFRTHWFNHHSRRAIAKLGAKQDGVLRNHFIDTEGIYRDTVVFSIIESEWPAVRRSLRHRLGSDKE